MNKYRISLILQGLLFLIPLNIYMWGEWIIVDLQWALFRYQQSSYGNSLILGYKDINYIFMGQTTGLYTVLATLFWTTGSILIIIGFLVIIRANLDNRSSILKRASLAYQRCYGSSADLPFLSVFPLFSSLGGGCSGLTKSPNNLKMNRMTGCLRNPCEPFTCQYGFIPFIHRGKIFRVTRPRTTIYRKTIHLI